MGDAGNRHPLTWGTNGIGATFAGGAQFVLSSNHFLGGCLAVLAGTAFTTAIFLDYSRLKNEREGKGGNAGTPGNKGTARRGASKGKQGSKKGFQTVVAIVGLLVVGSDMYALVTYKPPTLPAPVPVTAAPAATGPVSASAEGNHTVSIAGGSNNSVTFSDTSSSGNTPGKTKKGQK